MEVSEVGCCDDEGFASKVVILVALLSYGLRFPFCCPLKDIMNLLDLATVQLHLFFLKMYMCACIVFCMALEPLGDFYPNLIAREFLAFCSMRALKGSMLNFRKKEKGQALPKLESRYSNAKHGSPMPLSLRQRKFLGIFRLG